MTSNTATDIDVLSNIALVMKAFLDRMKEDFPKAHWVYDEGLSYDTALKTYRANQTQKGTTEPFLPAFVFRRSVVKVLADGAGKRLTTVKFLGPVPAPGKPRDTYRAFQGEIALSFMFIADSAEQMERFEVSYLAGAGLAGNVLISSEIPELGDWTYAVRHEPLDEIVVSHEGNYFKAVLGQCQIRGVFLLFDGDSSIITTINQVTKTFREQVLYTAALS